MRESINVFTAFSGYDSQCMALDRLSSLIEGFSYNLVGWSEIEPTAILAHNAVYPQYSERNYGDISKIDWSKVPDFDLFTYSFPCTDISGAGKQKGLEKGSGTRSSLLWCCEEAIVAKRPKYLLLENVKALTNGKFKGDFDVWLSILRKLGYSNYVKVLNAQDYGVPQSRERVFVVSVLDDRYFEFPKPFYMNYNLLDVLEDSSSLKGKYDLNMTNISKYLADLDQKYNFNDVLTSGTPKIVNLTSKGTFKTILAGYFKYGGATLLSGHYDTTGNAVIYPTDGAIHIRKLTPTECFRLMGVTDDNIQRMLSTNISKSMLYKLAVNSIVIDVMVEIFKCLFNNRSIQII